MKKNCLNQGPAILRISGVCVCLGLVSGYCESKDCTHLLCAGQTAGQGQGQQGRQIGTELGPQDG